MEIYQRHSAQIKDAMQSILDSNARIFIACSGGGSGLQNLFGMTPGISKRFVGSIFPYDMYEFDEFIGSPLADSYASKLGAIALANAAYIQAQKNCFKKNNLSGKIIGLGISAALATDRRRKGKDRIHIAIKSKNGLASASIFFSGYEGDRESQSQLADLFGLNTLLWGLGKSQILIEGSIFENIDANSSNVDVQNSCTIWPVNQRRSFIFDGPMYIHKDHDDCSSAHIMNFKSDTVIIPASLNPFHFGHHNIAKELVKRGLKPIFEITTRNADKPEINPRELEHRVHQLMGLWPVILRHNCGLFSEKIEEYKTSFAVGFDTAKRLLDPKYQPELQNAHKIIEHSLVKMREREQKFYVASRVIDGVLRTTRDLDILPDFKDLFEDIFVGMDDISSTKIREAQ